MAEGIAEGEDIAQTDVAQGERRSLWAPALVLAFTVAAGAIHFAGADDRNLWYDEAHTFAIVRDGLGKTIQRLQKDVHPPLYFLTVAAIVKVSDSELALRLLSVIAATLLPPAVYLCAQRFAGRRAAVIAAALAAFSPILHNYSIDARAYALLPLLSVVVLYIFSKAVDRHPAVIPWIAYAVAIAVLLNVHNYGAFLLPVPVLLTLIVGGERRISMFVAVSVASAAAFLTYLPWFLIAANARHGTHWVQGFWELEAAFAVFRSLEVFGVGGDYPNNIRTLGHAPAFRFLAIPLTFGVLAVGLSGGKWRDGKGASNWLLAGFLFGPLLLTQAYSYLRWPIYLIGRYDVISLPPFLILYAMGLDKLLRKPFLGAGLLAGFFTIVLNTVTLVSSITAESEYMYNPKYMHITEHLLEHADEDEPIVFIGDCRPVIDYYLHRSRRPFNLISFPKVLAEVPGSFDPDTADPAELQREADDLAQNLLAISRQGRAIWLIGSAQLGSESLIDPLFAQLEADDRRSDGENSVICLLPPGDSESTPLTPTPK